MIRRITVLSIGLESYFSDRNKICLNGNKHEHFRLIFRRIPDEYKVVEEQEN